MLTNYIKIAWRNLIRQKGFSFINISGLAIGIATCLIIMLYIFHELSYDRYNEKADQIVRVVFRGFMGGGEMKEANVMPPVGKTLRSDYPEVLEATRIQTSGSPMVNFGEKTFKETDVAFSDANFFEVFTVPLLKGNPATALLEPNTVVISKEVAERYFGNEDPIGKVLNFKSWKSNYKVTGVYDKIPARSHFHFNMIASLVTNPDEKSDSWMTSNYFTYIVLPKGYNYKDLEAKLPEVINKYAAPQLNKAFGMSIEEFRKKGNDIGLFLQPLTDIHLRSDLNGDLASHSNISYIYIFGAIAVFMLLIACINFMNLSTAGASKRAKEVGIRKVMGSMRSELIRQFLVESVLITVISFAIAIVLVYLTLPIFNSLAEAELSLGLASNIWLVPALLIFALLVGSLAGSYPALFLSSFKPVAVLKGTFNLSRSSGPSLRSSLVVFQFFISIVLIISTVVVHKQLTYIQNKKLGYDREQVMVIHDTWQLGQSEVFQNSLLQDPRIVSVSNSSFLPAGNTNFNNFSVYPEDKVGQLVKTPRHTIDHNYIPTMGIELSSGRNFSKELASDSLGVVINETAAKAFGWEKDALGHRITGTSDNIGTKITYHIIGVVKDFHFKSLHDPITPVMLVLGNDRGNMIVKVKTVDISGLISSIKNKWTAEEPFAYSFMDERFNNTYRAEQKVGNILNIFAGLTIFVACLGLFGLATFTAQLRTKEIGVRKVLGASVTGIATLLSKDFIKLVLVAIVLASPVAWYLTGMWLQDFAYRIDVSWWMFVSAGFAAVIIALVTVSFQAIKAALMNPVKSLRSE